MAKEYRIRVRGKQRDDIDPYLMAQLVVMLGQQLADDAKAAMEAEAKAKEEDKKKDQENVPANESSELPKQDDAA